MSTLDLLAAALTAPTARGRQTQTGASQLYGCRAEAVLRLTGVTATDLRPRLDAENGTAIHAWLESRLAALAGDDLLVEQRYTYRGVPATVDLIFQSERRLVDLKTKGNAAAIATVRRDGPSPRYQAQVHLGAAAANDAGVRVDTVELLFLPRDGYLSDAWSWSAPFDRTAADKAAEWAAEVDALAVERAGLTPAEAVEGLRDEPPSFCWHYCAFVTACRGERPSFPPVDEGVADVAAEYLAAKALEEEAKDRAARARVFLEDYQDLRSVGLQWAGGGSRVVEELDVEQVRFLLGGELPVRLVEKSSARSLRRVK